MGCQLAVLVCVLFLGCSQPQKQASQPNIISLREVDYPGLHNLMKITPRIYSGSEPHGEVAFASLAKLGIKTVVSVDGAIPDLKMANKYGLRYVHIPIGYDGINADAGLAFAKVGRSVDGSMYVHCHHGKHRGPAAAAIVCIASGAVDHQGALEILDRAGTSKNYAGLWHDVEHYQLPKADVKLPKLVEVAPVDSLAAAMAKIDRVYDNLKLCRDSHWQTPADHPDLNSAQQALLLKEGLRESARHLADGYNDEFKTWLNESESFAQKLEEQLQTGDQNQCDATFKLVVQSCKQCHQKYRN